MAYQKNFPYISLAKNTARAQSTFIIQEERKMALCSVKDWIFVPSTVCVLMPYMMVFGGKAFGRWF